MKRVLAIPILFLIVFVFFIYFFLPAYLDIKELKEAIARKESELEKQRGALLSLAELSEKLQMHQEALLKINSGLPKETSFASLLGFFQKKAEETGVLLKSFVPSEPLYSRETTEKTEGEEQKVSAAQPKEAYFSLTMTAPFFSLENFIKTIEKSSRLIEVETLSLSRKQKDSGSLDLDLFIKVYSY